MLGFRSASPPPRGSHRPARALLLSARGARGQRGPRPRVQADRLWESSRPAGLDSSAREIFSTTPRGGRCRPTGPRARSAGRRGEAGRGRGAEGRGRCILGNPATWGEAAVAVSSPGRGRRSFSNAPAGASPHAAARAPAAQPRRRTLLPPLRRAM